MDPASAIGVAAAAAQFLGIALKAIELCYQIRDNDDAATDHNRQLEEYAKELKASSSELTHPVAGRVPRRITEVAKKCDRLTKEVLDLLQHVRGAGKNVSTARRLYRVMKDAKKIEKVERSLKEEERVLESLLIRDIWSIVNADSLKSSTQFKSLDAKIQAVIQDLDRIQLRAAGRAVETSKEIAFVQTGIQNQIGRSAASITRKIARADLNALDRLRDVERKAREIHESDLQKKLEDDFLESLSFGEMYDRQVSIQDAAPGTLDWVFHNNDTDSPDADTSDTDCLDTDTSNTDPTNPDSLDEEQLGPRIPTRKPTRHIQGGGFHEWLCNDNSPFWICGKLGSGKSTLVAHIIQDPRTRQGLDRWKGDCQLCIFKFFFWRAGSELQRSILGLLRSLLYQICQFERRLVPRILSALSTNASIIPVWTIQALKAGIIKAFDETDHLRFSIFIDGIDEFIGDYNELLDLILELQVHSHVKVCVSSRPENQIIRKLSHCKKLHLENLNLYDIDSFVRQRLEQASIHLPLIQDESASWYIATKAEGVFLYAALVTQAVIQGAASGEDEGTLLERIASVPPGIEDIFKSFLGQIDDLQRQSLAFYLSLMKLSSRITFFDFGQKLLLIPIISLARLGIKVTDVEITKFPEIYFQTEAQIRAYSAGLLDVPSIQTPYVRPENDWLSPHAHKWYSPAQRVGDANWPRCQAPDRPAPYIELLYAKKRMAWIHRSAYDFMNDADAFEKSVFSEMPIEVALQKVLAASIIHFALAPSVSSPDGTFRSSSMTRERLSRIIPTMSGGWPISSFIVSRALDCLYQVYLQTNTDELTEFGFPAVVKGLTFWTVVFDYEMYEYALTRVSKIPFQSILPLMVRRVQYLVYGRPVGDVQLKLRIRLLASVRRMVKTVQFCPRTSKKCVRFLVDRKNPLLPSLSYREARKSHGSHPTLIEIRNATAFAFILNRLPSVPPYPHLIGKAIEHFCAICRTTDFFVGLANSGGRLFLQIAGSLYVDRQRLTNEAFRKRGSSEPLLRLICVPWPVRMWYAFSHGTHIAHTYHDRYFENIERFIKIDLSQRITKLFLRFLGNHSPDLYSGLHVPVYHSNTPWPCIHATKEELDTCQQLILEDVLSSEELCDSTEKLFALACLRMHLRNLLESIWVRVMHPMETNTESTSRHSGSERSERSESSEIGEGADASDWCTDEETTSPEGSVDEASDSEWWTDDEEISDARRWQRSRDKLWIIPRKWDENKWTYAED